MKKINKLIVRLAHHAPAVQPAPHPFVLSFGWVVVAAFYLAISLMISGARPVMLLALQNTWFAAEIAALLALFISTSVSAALLSYPDLYQMRRIAFAPIMTFALFVLVIFLAWQADYPPAPLPEHSVECTLSIAVFAMLPTVWMFYVMRKFASTHLYLAGGTALLFAFSVGALWLRLYEQNNSITHVIQWHYLPMLGFGLIGMWLGKVVLKW